MFERWYVVAAVVLTAVVQFFRKNPTLASKIWARIPVGWRWLVPFLAGALAALFEELADGADAERATLAFLRGGFGIGVTAMGLAAALRESPIPWDGGAGGKQRLLSHPPSEDVPVLVSEPPAADVEKRA